MDKFTPSEFGHANKTVWGKYSAPFSHLMSTETWMAQLHINVHFFLHYITFYILVQLCTVKQTNMNKEFIARTCFTVIFVHMTTKARELQ